MMNDLRMDPAFGKYRLSWRIFVVEAIEIEAKAPKSSSYD